MTTATLSRQCPVCGFELPAPLPVFCPRPSCGVEFLPGDAGPVHLRTFRLVGHYALFVLPFSFVETDGADPVRRVIEAGRWRQRVFSASDPGDVDRTEYFLPYIRRFLFPTLYDKPAATKGAAEAEPTCRHFEFDLARLGADAHGLGLTLRCRDGRKRLSFEHRLGLTGAELILFSYRVGFLVLRVECADAGATYFDQMNVVAYLRTIAPLYRGFEMPELDTGSARYGVPQLLPYLLAEFGGAVAPPGPQAVAPGTPLPVKPIYDDRMMVYTFSCLDKEACLADATRCQALLHRATVVNFDRQASTLPERDHLEADPDAWLRTRWQGFSKDGGSLVVFNTDAYHERYAGVYQATYYFDIFLLATLQRVTLLTLFERLADIQGLTRGGAPSRRLLRRVRRELLLFKNQCWFSQITNRERGLILWKKWQKTLETRTLFKEVNEQSAELDAYTQTRYRERMERLVRIGGFVAAAIPFVWGLDKFFEQADWARVARWVALALLLLGSAAAAKRGGHANVGGVPGSGGGDVGGPGSGAIGSSIGTPGRGGVSSGRGGSDGCPGGCGGSASGLGLFGDDARIIMTGSLGSGSGTGGSPGGKSGPGVGAGMPGSVGGIGEGTDMIAPHGWGSGPCFSVEAKHGRFRAVKDCCRKRRTARKGEIRTCRLTPPRRAATCRAATRS